MPQAQLFGGLNANLSIDEEIVPSCGFTGILHSTEHQVAHAVIFYGKY